MKKYTYKKGKKDDDRGNPAIHHSQRGRTLNKYLSFLPSCSASLPKIFFYSPFILYGPCRRQVLLLIKQLDYASTRTFWSRFLYRGLPGLSGQPFLPVVMYYSRTLFFFCTNTRMSSPYVDRPGRKKIPFGLTLFLFFSPTSSTLKPNQHDAFKIGKMLTAYAGRRGLTYPSSSLILVTSSNYSSFLLCSRRISSNSSCCCYHPTRVRTLVSCWRVPKKPVKNPETRKAVPSISGYTVSPRAQAQTNLAFDTEPLSPPFSLIESDFLKNFLKKSKRIVRRIDRLDIATLFFFPFLHRVLLFIGVALWVPEIGKDKS